MKKLDTIQKENRLNDVFAVDGPGPGGAYHEYSVCVAGEVFIDGVDNVLSTEPNYAKENPFLCDINFQCGPRNENGSVSGVLDSDLLEIVRDRLSAFQDGPFACGENAEALLHVEAALNHLDLRQRKRSERGVLGTYQP